MSDALENLRWILLGLWKYRWSALLVVFLAGAAGYAAVLQIPNRYEATARVYVDTQTILKPLMVGLTVQPNVDQQISMMARTLLSRPNVDRIARMSDLDLRTKTPRERDQLVDELTKAIKFQTAGANNLYTIVYQGETPDSSRRVVQSLVSIFVESNLGDKRRDADQARRFIDEQIVILEKRLADAESKLKDFKIRNMGMLPDRADDYVARSSEARKELAKARSELREAEGGRDALKRELMLEAPQARSPDAKALETPAAVIDVDLPRRMTNTDLRVEQLRKRLDELLVRYTDEHPDVVSVRAMLKQLEDQQAVESTREAQVRAAAPAKAPRQAELPSTSNSAYQSIRTSLAEAEAQVASLRARVADAAAVVAANLRAAQTVPAVEAEFAQLNRDYEINKKNFEQLLGRRESAKLSDSMDANSAMAEFRVVDPPRASPQAVWPNRPVFLSLVLLASLALGIVYALARELMAPKFYSPKTLRQLTQLPVLGAVTLLVDPSKRLRQRLATFAFSGALSLYLLVFGGSIARMYLSAIQT